MTFEIKIEVSAQDIIELGSKVTEIISILEDAHKKSIKSSWVIVDAQTSKCERCGHIAKTAEEKTYFCPDCGSYMKNPSI